MSAQHHNTEKDRLNAYQIFVLCILAVVNMQDGFDILAISFAANAITQDWGISRAELGVVFSAGLFGMMIGAMSLSPLADKFGRKKVIIAGLFASGVGMLIAMQAGSISMLVIGRILTGLGVGGILASLNTLVSEYAGERYRGFAVSIVQLGFPTGAFLSGYIAAWLLDIGTWRYVFAFGAFTSFIFIPVIMLLPESTSFLAKQNKPGALEKINRIQAKFGRSSLESLPLAEDGAGSKSVFSEVGTLFNTQYRLRTALIWMSFFCLLTLIYFMLSWTPKILIDMGFTEAQGNQGGRMINLVGMLGIIILGFLSLRYKPSFISSFYMGAAVVIMLALSTVKPEFTTLLILLSLVGFCLHGSVRWNFVRCRLDAAIFIFRILLHGRFDDCSGRYFVSRANPRGFGLRACAHKGIEIPHLLNLKVFVKILYSWVARAWV